MFGDSRAFEAFSTHTSASSDSKPENAVVGSAGGGTQQTKLKPFLETSYSYMPLMWGATLAFWLGPALTEGGHILPVST